jgi:hypothetical protein
MRLLPRAFLGATAVALLVVMYLTWAWHEAPWGAKPDRLHFCGRYFGYPGATVPKVRVQLEGDGRIGTVWTWQGRREVWGKRVTILGADGCGTGLYLRTGPNAFQGYALLGGP